MILINMYSDSTQCIMIEVIHPSYLHLSYFMIDGLEMRGGIRIPQAKNMIPCLKENHVGLYMYLFIYNYICI